MASTVTLIGAKTGIESTAAGRGQCRGWVKTRTSPKVEFKCALRLIVLQNSFAALPQMQLPIV